ncbi:amidohydrolase family protein [Variovorax terrae]|uniref:Amidohydrolase n=1 Tax=Variovorax terrae TaxID=2923278 RepID=A0A9X1VXC6_9BURK|nr:amidohydrolase family protein [Variovorax terrae]MCJ0765556.1 amidohydrolase [Variovorax terrae]
MLLHTCTLACPAGCAHASPGPVGPAGHRFTVDLHAHALTLAVEPLVAGRPEKQAEPALMRATQGEASVAHNLAHMLPPALRRMTNLAERLADMDAMGVDVQVLSPSPTQYYYWADPDLAQDVVRLQNEHIAAECARHPERLAGLGTVALQHPRLAAEQLAHAMRELGLKGVEISASVNGRELADPSLEPFWARASELGALVFIHPLGTSLGERVNRHYLANTIGQPLETTIALSELIFGGVLDRHTGVKLVAAHGGGYLPAYFGRSQHAHQVRPEAQAMQHAPRDYLRRIWFDTLVYEPEVLRHLVEVVGAAQLVVGTDYPFDMGHYDPQGLVDAVPGLSRADADAILGLNAAALLGLCVPSPSSNTIQTHA